MDAANVIALVGIVTGGTVAITAQIFVNRREAATRQHTERLQKETEARTVLDGALATAYDARAALDEYEEAVARLSNSIQDPGKFHGVKPRPFTPAPMLQPASSGWKRAASSSDSALRTSCTRATHRSCSPTSTS